MTHIGSHLLGRLQSPPDDRDLQLEFFLSPAVSDLQKALAVLEVSHAAKATKQWAAVATSIIGGFAPPPSPGPPPDPAPPGPPQPAPAGGVWRLLDPVLNQGDFGTCVGNGWAQFGNVEPYDDHYAEKDARAIYYEATVEDGQPDDPDAPGGGQQGSTVRSGAKAMQKRGRIAAYAFASTTDAIKAWVEGNGPVVVGTDWTNAMFATDAGYYVHPTGGVAGGHCYLLVGYLPAEDAFVFLNSWGSGWGDRGLFKMKVGDFDTLLQNGGEACVALEVATA